MKNAEETLHEAEMLLSSLTTILDRRLDGYQFVGPRIKQVEEIISGLKSGNPLNQRKSLSIHFENIQIWFLAHDC